MGVIVITERVYLDDEGKATTDEAKAVRLWATPGSEVLTSEAEAVSYGTEKPKAVKRPGGTKVVEGPEGDK